MSDQIMSRTYGRDTRVAHYFTPRITERPSTASALGSAGRARRRNFFSSEQSTGLRATTAVCRHTGIFNPRCFDYVLYLF
jgi:hypothetical protein